MKVTEILTEIVMYRSSDDLEGFRSLIKSLNEYELNNLKTFAEKTLIVCNSRLEKINID